MEIRIEVVKGPETGRVFIIDEPTTCIAGRSPDALIRFSEEDPYISRKHFLLEIAPPKVYFKDLDVTNSSRINARPVDEAELNDGDMIEVGFTTLRVAVKFDTKPIMLPCYQCGANFEVLEDDGAKRLCPRCLRKKKEAEAKAEPAPPDATPLTIRCECGRDLSQRADSDGRARELLGKVHYCCEKCLPKQDRRIARKINEYEVLKRLGEGRMGVVFLVYHRPTARLLVLKEMKIVNKRLGNLFYQEIKIMKTVAHENVLAYVDSGQNLEDGKPYMVMEYAPLGSLDDLLKRNLGPLPYKAAVIHIIRALKGLERIHKEGYVHRNIKPENILLKRRGQRDLIPMIADFGQAREFSKVGGTVLTQLGKASGTILFLAPEHIRDQKQVGAPADIYAMGVTLYHLLTWQYPFDFPTPIDVMKYMREHKVSAERPVEGLKALMEIRKLKNPHLIILEEKPIPILERKPDLPPALAEAVDKAIRKRISERHQTAGEFGKALEQAVIKQQVKAG